MKAIPSIEDIKDGIKVQERVLVQAHDDEWQSIISGDDVAIKVSRRNREIAEQKVKDEKIRLSDAFGLGDDGYWAQQSKTYGNAKQTKAQEVNQAHAYARGTGGVSNYNKGMQHAYQNEGDGIQLEQQRKEQAKIAANKGMNHAYQNMGDGIQLEQQKKQQAEAAHAYAKGTGGVSNYATGMNHAMGNIGDGIQLEQQRKEQTKLAANKGMLNAYGNVGDGLRAEQVRKAAGYNKGMLNAYGNIGDGLKAEQARKVETRTGGMVGRPQFSAGGTQAMHVGLDDEFVHGTQHFVSGDETTPENAYGQYTGGVDGNYKPPALREAEQAVTAFDIAYNKIEELTGVDPIGATANIVELTNDNKLDMETNETWTKAAEILAEAEAETGMTYDDALKLLSKEEKEFEDNEYKYSNKELNKLEDTIYISGDEESLFNGVSPIDNSHELEEKVLKVISDSGKFLSTTFSIKDFFNIEDEETSINICQNYDLELSEKEGFGFYSELFLQGGNEQNSVESTLAGLIPGGGEIYTAHSLSQGTSDMPDMDFYDKLGGDYTVTTYVYEAKAHNDLETKYYVGIVLLKDDIVLENGESVEYPFNMTAIMEIPKKSYDYMNYTYGTNE